jgi:type IV pilus assembly protein PilB
MKKTRPSPPNPTQAVAPPAPAAAADDDLLDLDQAIARLATTRPTFYRWLRSGRLTGLKVGRQWRFRRQDIEGFLRGESTRAVLTADIGPIRAALAKRLQEAGGTAENGGDPVEQTVKLMISLGVALQASDLHLETMHDEHEPQLRLRYRIDGALHECVRGDHRLLAPLIQQWKRLTACDLNERRLPQDGRLMARIGEANCDLRACFLPAVLGEIVTVRFLSRTAILSLDSLPITLHSRKRLDAALAQPWGFIICTGPTGNGKTTTMYACLGRLTGPAVKVLSVEDPVEYRLSGVTQVAVQPQLGLTFASVLRAMQRSAPDVIQIGEIRDRETLQIALQVVLTGHQVLSQMHTPDAASALQRMVELGVDPWVVAESTRLVIGQRLVRRLCPHCSTPVQLDRAQEEQAAAIAHDGGLVFADLPRSYRRAVGCPKCGQTGFSGRTMINEMLVVGPEVGAALRQSAPVGELRRIAINQGMTSLAADGLWRAARGETSFDEVLRTVPAEI